MEGSPHIYIWEGGGEHRWIAQEEGRGGGGGDSHAHTNLFFTVDFEDVTGVTFRLLISANESNDVCIFFALRDN